MLSLRLPVAALFGVLFTTAMFWFLWVMIVGGGGAMDLRPATRIDFTPLRHDTATETKRDKIERPKPQQVPEMPDEPHTLAYLAAISLQVPNAEKQDFLAIEQTAELLARLFKTCQREVALLQALTKGAQPGSIERFSVN